MPALAHHDGPITNGALTLEFLGGETVGKLRRNVDETPSFLGAGFDGTNWRNGGGASLTLRYTDPIFQWDLEHGAFGAPFVGPDLAQLDSGRFGASEVTQTWPGMARLAIVTEVALDPSGGESLTFSAWLKNIGSAPVLDPIVYLVVEPNSESSEGDDAARRVPGGAIVAQRAADASRALAVRACGTRADGEIGDFNVTTRLMRGELTNASTFEGDVWIAEGVTAGGLAPGDVAHVAFRLAMANDGAGALAASTCDDPRARPLLFWDDLPDFAILDMRIDDSPLVPTPLSPWTIELDLVNRGLSSECRMLAVNSERWMQPTGTRVGPRLVSSVCLAPGEVKTETLQWSAVDAQSAIVPTGRVDFRAIVDGGIYSAVFDAEPDDNSAQATANGPLGLP